LALAVVVIAALIINNHILWIAVDIAMILVCSVSGVLLLRKK
jgi:hypothetical protein